MDNLKHWSGLALVGCLIFGAVVASPARADERPQLAAQPSATDLRQIEQELYDQGYQRISHMRLENGLLSARALDESKRPVFLGVAPDTGRVVASVALD
ncbi:MAG: PepSY domain-containing protein [Rhodospirillales bacterium]|nr:PepSY domain-containing protein [Rhodospirillales bacterium]